MIIRLFLTYSAYQLVLHSYYLLEAKDPKLFIPTLIAFSHDIAILAIVSIFFKAIISIFSANLKRLPSLFTIAIIIIGATLAFYPGILREYMVFPVNIFESDLSNAETFVNDYLGLQSLLNPLIAILLGVVVSLSKWRVNLPRYVIIIGLMLIATSLVFTIKQSSPHPLIYGIQKEVENMRKFNDRVVLSLQGNTKNTDIAGQINTLSFSDSSSLEYDNILLVVFEGVTSASFEEGFLTISDGFFERFKNKSVYYNNYYASNLDSYTSLIAMLTSIQVPYRAYAGESVYDKVNSAPSVTSDLQNRGFNNVFISCYEYQPFVPTKQYWDVVYERNDLPDIGNWLTIGRSKMEKATEDKAAISTITKILKEHPKNFILHEMVYGHSPEWEAKSGKSQNEYHNEYLIQLSDALINDSLFNRTLLVIVSDHGDRARSADMENYRVPLLILGNGIKSLTYREEFLTHTALPQLMYHYIADEDHPASRKESFFVGSSVKWVYGKATINKHHLFIDDVNGTVLQNEGMFDAESVRNEFQEYVNLFSHQYGNQGK